MEGKEFKTRAMRHFIVKSEQEFKEKYVTEGGIELFADNKFSSDRLANKVVTILQLPVAVEALGIKVGYELMIDPTIYYRQNYEGIGRQENAYMLDRRNGIFKVEPKMIVLYRENAEAEWKGAGDNLVVEVVKTQEEEKAGSLIVSLGKVTEKTYVKYSNTEMQSQDVNAGDEVKIAKGLEVPFWIENKEYFWVESKDVLAKLN